MGKPRLHGSLLKGAFMFRMNGMPRAQGCAGAACVGIALFVLDTYVAPERLRVAHPCAPSRSTVHPEHNPRLYGRSKGCAF